MENEKDDTVAVTGCADEQNLEGKIYVTLISKRFPTQSKFVIYLDSFGASEELKRGLRKEIVTNRVEMIDEDEIDDEEIEAKASTAAQDGAPCTIKAKIRLGTDASAKEQIEKRLHRDVDGWLAEMFTHVQAHFLHPSLQHRINFEVWKNSFTVA